MKRRTYLIKKDLQIKYAFMVGIPLIIMICFVEIHTYMTMKTLFPHILSSTIGSKLKGIQISLHRSTQR